MKFDDVKSVDEGCLCIGCGLCASIAGSENIRMEMGEDGFYHPLVKGSCDEWWPVIKKVCPGLVLNLRAKSRSSHEKLWGPLICSYIGYASDEKIRHIASSGGAITAILSSLLENKLATAVIHAGKSKDNPLKTAPGISYTMKEILEKAGSRYAPVPSLESIVQLLSDKNEKVVFVGKPCEVAALRAYVDISPAIGRKIVCMISFFCAGTPSQNGTLKILEELGRKEMDVKDFWYRGRGWPGKATVVTKDNSIHSMSYSDSWGKILNRYLHFRCKVCPDGTGSFADISCADAWEEKDGYPDFEEKPGQSLIITRTEKGESVFQKAVKTNYLVADPYEISMLDRIQKYQKERKLQAGARLLGLRLAGMSHPKFKGLNLFYNWRKNTVKSNSSNTIGMFKRVIKSRKP